MTADIRLDWNAGKFKQTLVAALVANAELVGEFVEAEARRRLLAFTDLAVTVPGRATPRNPQGNYVGGGPYRAYVAGLLANDVQADAKGVTIRVGVRPGRGGSHHGLYIELGSRTAPARPFLRPAVFENAARIIQVLAGK